MAKNRFRQNTPKARVGWRSGKPEITGSSVRVKAEEPGSL